MTKKRKKTKRNFNTEPASNRIFYRRPSVMFAETMWSGFGFVLSVAIVGPLYAASAILIHILR